MAQHRKITKAVIAAAGYGTRFLPATKNQPKEMLPIIDKPIIHYLVEEAVASGITDIILVTRAGQSIMEDYFDNNLELEYSLAESGKEEKLAMVRNIPQLANFIYVRQRKHLPYGNATPLLCAQNLIDDDEAFVFMFGDDMTLSSVPVTKQLIDVYERERPTAVLGVQEVTRDVISRYGAVKYKDGTDSYEIESLVEKPNPDEAPSLMAQFGRFVLTNKVLEQARKIRRGKDNELWLADISNDLAHQGERIIAHPIEGEWLTTGDPLNYLQTTLKFAMQREDLRDDLKAFLKDTL